MPLLGKRKRAASEPAAPARSPPPAPAPSIRAPLTAENLARVCVCAMSTSKKTQNSLSRSSSQKSKASASPVKLKRLLECANVRINSKEHLPGPLQALVNSLLDGPTPASPSAAHVVKLAPSLEELYERDGIDKAHPYLIGKDALQEGGLAMISSCLDVPLARAFLPDIEDEVTRDLHGMLAQAQPDTMLGYMNWTLAQSQGLPSAFTKDEEACSETFSITDRVQYPFLSTQWKSAITNGGHAHAQIQCARDGACVVRFLEHFYCYARASEPAPEETCHFSISVDLQSAHVYVHWRNGATIEMSVIKRVHLAELDQVTSLRRFIRKLVTHANGLRLQSLKSALASLRERYKTGQPPLRVPVRLGASSASASASASALVEMPPTPKDLAMPANKRLRTASLHEVLLGAER